ncbi:DUF4245 family protein [Blastococcus brunescens]|uniref:DUF4245 family protein n=1 Tax=Blastococcus brunescens TaxID=1564165 RepID=A0ABZ1B1Y8_9ACTN|nr:DUF4245 family protein [Blastococcus sp. BMG 8361]WRL64826.1 DUF4245 family protein [Blastococcus sp. BMG 8361]
MAGVPREPGRRGAHRRPVVHDPARLGAGRLRGAGPGRSGRGLPPDQRPHRRRQRRGGDPVTLEIGYLTPEEEFAGFVVSDDRAADPLAAALDGADDDGTVDLDGRTWTRSTTVDGETALWREADGVTVLVSGSASDEELQTVAESVAPYRG